MYPTLMRQGESTAPRRRIPIWLVDATDGITAETGVTGTPRVAKNGVSSSAANAAIVQVDVTNMPGLYYLELTAGEVDTLGQIFVSFKTAATAQWHGIITVVDYDPFDTVRMGMTALPNAAAEAPGGLYTRGTGAGQINQQTNGQIDSNIERVRNAILNILVGSRMDSSVGAMATDVLNAAALAADAVDEIRDGLLPTQNAAFSNIEFLFVDSTDHVTPVTGATGISATRSIDGGAFVGVSGAIAEVGNGIYQFDALAADMNGGVITFRFIATGGTPNAPDDRFITIVTGGGV